MEVKPSKGVTVKVGATKEAVFGEDGVEVKRISPLNGDSAVGVLTGRTLAGYCEVEMPKLDSKYHWYPVDQLAGEQGEKIMEEEIVVDVDETIEEEEI